MGQSLRKPKQIVSAPSLGGTDHPQDIQPKTTGNADSWRFSYQDESRQRTEQPYDVKTPSTFYTATPGYGTGISTPGRLNPDTEYGRVLREQKLVVAKEVETNWSGRGQHVEFGSNEIVPLEPEKPIGHSATALVESVRCRRIRLARKSIRCNRRARLEDLIKEVAYLHRLRHPHIIQLVGTYLQNKMFAMLLYPVATGNLDGFLEELEAFSPGSPARLEMEKDLARFFFCLTHALRYMHEQGIRHMDIKPSNILVNNSGSRGGRSIYFTDFGISRAFTEEDGSQTAGPAAMTKRWCSPEAAAQQPRGRAADIFSLGCVFATMYTSLVSASLANFERARAESGEGDAFHLALPQVNIWLDKVSDYHQRDIDEPCFRWSPWQSMLELLKGMVSKDPEQRPTATDVADRLEHAMWWKPWSSTARDIWRCCSALPEGYRGAEEEDMSTSFW